MLLVLLLTTAPAPYAPVPASVVGNPLPQPAPKARALELDASAGDASSEDDPNRKVVALSISVPRAVFRIAVAQVEFLFNEYTSLALQGGWGKPTVTRQNASDLKVPLLDVGLQFRGWFTGSSWDGGFFGGLAGEYAHGTESGLELTLDAFGAGLVLGYKWAFDPGPFIDLNGGAGWGYMLASGAEDLEGRGISVFPFVNLNVGWAF